MFSHLFFRNLKADKKLANCLVTKGRVRLSQKPVENENMREMGGGEALLYTVNLNEEIPDDYTVSPYGMQFPCSVVNIAILEQFSKYKISSSSIFSQSFHSCF